MDIVDQIDAQDKKNDQGLQDNVDRYNQYRIQMATMGRSIEASQSVVAEETNSAYPIDTQIPLLTPTKEYHANRLKWIGGIILLLSLLFVVYYYAQQRMFTINDTENILETLAGMPVGTAAITELLMVRPSDVANIRADFFSTVEVMTFIDSIGTLHIDKLLGVKIDRSMLATTLYLSTVGIVKFNNNTNIIHISPDERNSNMTRADFNTCRAAYECESTVPLTDGISWERVAMCCACMSHSICTTEFGFIYNDGDTGNASALYTCCSSIIFASRYSTTRWRTQNSAMIQSHKIISGTSNTTNIGPAGQDLCADQPLLCGNHGRCNVDLYVAACVCDEGWKGPTCAVLSFPGCSWPQQLIGSECVCSPGFSVQDTNTCTECPRGKYSANPNSTMCTDCPIGMFQPSWGAVGCVQCWPNTTNLVSGSASCSMSCD